MATTVYLITGCSSGFGALYVDEILKRGDKVIATARNSSRITKLKEKGAEILELDITWPQDKINAAIDAAIQFYGHIDVLINNAGFVVAGILEETTSEQWQSNFATNVFGSVSVTKAILPHFRSRRSGTIVFTGSLASYGGGPGLSTYSATKGAVSAIAESVAAETASLGIETLCFEPGYFRTELLSGNNLSRAPDVSIPDYGNLAKEIKDIFTSTSGNQAGDPKKGVNAMLDIIVAARSGKSFPVRIPIGDDVVQYCKRRSQKFLGDLKPLENVITRTNIDGVDTPPLEMLGLYYI